MKKEDVSGIIVYLLIFGLAIVFGLTILRTHAAESLMSRGTYILYICGAIAAGIIFNAFLFEFAHLLGAKVGRYLVVSFNVLGLEWYKEEKKTRFRFHSFDGLTGETKIVPNEKSEKTPSPLPYLWFGTLFYLGEITLIIVAFILLNLKDVTKLTNIAYFLLVMGVIGFMVLIYNILPFRLDAVTDGYRLTMVSNPKNKIAFNELLRVEHEIELGHNDVEIKTFEEITNFTADLNLNKVYVLLDKKEYDQAESLLDMIIDQQENVSEKVYIRAKAQKIYINLMTKEPAESRDFYETKVPVDERRAISNDISMASIRAYLLMSGLFDKSRSECIFALNNVYKAFKHTPKNRQPVELSLFNEALDKVIAAHPDWGLQDYKLIEKK